jgi:hypothetical protein
MQMEDKYPEHGLKIHREVVLEPRPHFAFFCSGASGTNQQTIAMIFR